MHVGVSIPRAQVMTQLQQPVPNPVLGTFLIDTGASHTSVDPTLLTTLGLTPTGRIPMLTPSTGTTPHMCNTYDVALIIPNPKAPGHFVNAISVIEASFVGQGIHGLMGRDVLAGCHFTYVGMEGAFVLSY
jgi:hypothetical protein